MLLWKIAGARKRTLAGRIRPISTKKTGGRNDEKARRVGWQGCSWGSHIIVRENDAVIG